MGVNGDGWSIDGTAEKAWRMGGMQRDGGGVVVLLVAAGAIEGVAWMLGSGWAH